MKALVLGLGISGQNALNFLEKRGWTVEGVDDRLAPTEIGDLREFDLFVPSPGVPRTHPLYQQAKGAGVRIAGEAQLALEAAVQPCIGVTGTNGKTTVVKMLEHCFNHCGKKARAVGNVGQPLTQYVGQSDEILIVELSSYQLETLTAQVFDVGIILNIAEDHLDRYTSFEEYANVKANLEHCIKPGGEFFVHADISGDFFSKGCHKFRGENEEAAYLVAQHFGISRSHFFDALSSFEKPPHRLEFVGIVDGVSYFNDSKATNVAAIVKALDLMKDDVVLIAGGQDKGLNFDPLCIAKEKLSCVVVFGQAREKIANALKHLVDVHQVETLREAVQCAKKLVKTNGTVLFSPGCASFDAFKNYAERGDCFKRFLKE